MTRDEDSYSTFHSKCDNHNNILIVVETSENKKFGGFTCLSYRNSGATQKDDNAFIFSLNNRENYYINKGKYAVNFYERGPNFGCTTNGGSEFHIMDSEPCLTAYNSYDDTGYSNCYDYGGRKHVLAGKRQFVVLDFEVFQISL